MDTPRVILTQGLAEQDDRLDALHALFEELQPKSVEAANPLLDLITFAGLAHYFGVINVESSGNSSLPPVVNNLPIDPYSSYPPGTLPVHPGDFAGFVYLIPSSQDIHNTLHIGELSVGIILKPEFRRLGVATEVMREVLGIAFTDLSCHRVQAVVADPNRNGDTVAFFVKGGFNHECVRRRAFFGPYDHEWKDVAYLAVLDTEYAVRIQFGTGLAPSAPKSLWDELLARHSREREELMHWEDRQGIKRSASSETLRNRTYISPSPSVFGGSCSTRSPSMSPTPSMYHSSSPSPLVFPPPKKRRVSDFEVKSEPEEEDDIFRFHPHHAAPTSFYSSGFRDSSLEAESSGRRSPSAETDPQSDANQEVYDSIREHLVNAYEHSSTTDVERAASPPQSASELQSEASFSRAFRWDMLNSSSDGSRSGSFSSWESDEFDMVNMG